MRIKTINPRKDSPCVCTAGVKTPVGRVKLFSVSDAAQEAQTAQRRFPEGRTQHIIYTTRIASTVFVRAYVTHSLFRTVSTNQLVEEFLHLWALKPEPSPAFCLLAVCDAALCLLAITIRV